MDDQNDIAVRIAGIESQMAQLNGRLAELENRVAAVSAGVADQQALRRMVEMKTGRSGEMSSRIAQRLARLESAVELLSRQDDPEIIDHV